MATEAFFFKSSKFWTEHQHMAAYSFKHKSTIRILGGKPNILASQDSK